jgi:hypothetical protein
MQTTQRTDTVNIANDEKHLIEWLQGETSMDAIRERELAKHWNDTKTCTPGDMNYKRHTGQQEYSNYYPCGTTCKACGTFWID